MLSTEQTRSSLSSDCYAHMRWPSFPCSRRGISPSSPVAYPSTLGLVTVTYFTVPETDPALP